MLGVVQILREMNYHKFELPYEIFFVWENRESYHE